MSNLVDVCLRNGEYHMDQQCAEDSDGHMPVLRMSMTAAKRRGFEQCLSCREADPGFGLDGSPEDYGVGDDIEVRTTSQWFRGRVAAVEDQPNAGVKVRLICDSPRGYDFMVERIWTDRVRVDKDAPTTRSSVVTLRPPCQ